MNSNNFEDTIDLKEIQDTLNGEELIKNKQLEDYIKFAKGKSKLEKADLETVEEIVLDSKTFTGEINFVDFKEIKLFPNLRKLRLYNLGISENEINLIKENTKVESLHLFNCELLGIGNLNKLKTLYLGNCDLENPNELLNLEKLEELTIDYTKMENYDFLEGMENLKKLYFINMTENDFNLLPELKNIEFLSIDGIDSFSIDKISKFSNLKVLSISKTSNIDKQEIEKIKENGIEILVEDVYDEL